ncbi:MAG: hypothetical protein WA610_01660 [Thermodesulfovibrionales bacterium]
MKTLNVLEDILSALAFTDAGEYAKALELLAGHGSFAQGAAPR